jgi:hypothetical protein
MYSIRTRQGEPVSPMLVQVVCPRLKERPKVCSNPDPERCEALLYMVSLQRGSQDNRSMHAMGLRATLPFSL